MEYRIVVSSDTSVGKIQRCMRELEQKVMRCMFRISDCTIHIDDADCNQDDVKGTLISLLGVDNIKEFECRC